MHREPIELPPKFDAACLIRLYRTRHSRSCQAKAALSKQSCTTHVPPAPWQTHQTHHRRLFRQQPRSSRLRACRQTRTKVAWGRQPRRLAKPQLVPVARIKLRARLGKAARWILVSAGEKPGGLLDAVKHVPVSAKQAGCVLIVPLIICFASHFELGAFLSVMDQGSS